MKHPDILSQLSEPNMPVVSIIMNVRNGSATLRDAINSALSQTFRDWEMIVWDDGSTDDSRAVVGSFTDPRIHYFVAPQESMLGQARDAAMRRAQGEWLAFLDQDDVWLPCKLERQVLLTADPLVGLVYGRTLNFGPGGVEEDYDAFHEFTPLPDGDIVAELLSKGCFVSMSSALIRHAAVQTIGGIPAHIHMIPDYFLFVAVCSGYSARAVQEVVCHYRLHAGSMTKLYRRESLEEALRLVDDWRSRLPQDAYARRRARISTALAVEEMRRATTFSQGMRRLLESGSILWLAGRPWVRMWRRVRRRLRQPYWKKATAGELTP